MHELAEHIIRMEVNEVPRVILDSKFGTVRKVGEPKLRWLDSVSGDVRNNLGTPN